MVMISHIKMKLYKLKIIYKTYGGMIFFKTLYHKLTFFDRKIEDGLTIIITSAGRLKYLKRTIKSLQENLRNVNDEINWFIIDDNPLSTETKEYILSQKFDLQILNSKNYGLGYSLNKIYSKIRTKYIFHCEDDWLFKEKIPIERMKEILDNNKTIGQVILNRKQNYKSEASCIEGKDYSLYEKTYSFNPHLTTLKKSLLCLPFPLHNTEVLLTKKMRKKGIKTVILGYGKTYFVSHIGVEKNVEKY